MSISISDEERRDLNTYLQRLLYAHKKDGITSQKVQTDLLEIIEAAAQDDREAFRSRMRMVFEQSWDD